MPSAGSAQQRLDGADDARDRDCRAGRSRRPAGVVLRERRRPRKHRHARDAFRRAAGPALRCGACRFPGGGLIARAVVLAAGSAQRLRPLTDTRPKCLLPVGERTIISRAVAILAGHGIRAITIVDGFEGDQLRAALTAEFPAAWFDFVRNPDFATTNNAWSLLLARRAAPESLLLLDGDVLFDAAVIGRLLASEKGNRIALRTT